MTREVYFTADGMTHMTPTLPCRYAACLWPQCDCDIEPEAKEVTALRARIAELEAENERLRKRESVDDMSRLNTTCPDCHYWPCKCPRLGQ